MREQGVASGASWEGEREKEPRGSGLSHLISIIPIVRSKSGNSA